MNYKKSIIIGFLTVYVLSMVFSTKMIQDNYRVRHIEEKQHLKDTIQMYVANLGAEREDINLLNYLLTYPLTQYTELKYNQFSAAIYDKQSKELLAQSSVMVTDSRWYHLEQQTENVHAYAIGHMNREFLDLVVQAEVETKEAEKNKDYPIYMYMLQSNGQAGDVSISFKKIIWDKAVDGGIYDPLKSSVLEFDGIWRGSHGTTQKDREYAYMSQNFQYYDLGILVPYLESGYNSWKDNRYLQEFPELLSEDENTYDLENSCVLVIRQDSNAWLAAMDYMKYVYIGAFVIMMACMLKVLHTTNKAYKQKEKLEETRRDFTNAIAHELKTPLGIIRGFAENLEENTNEEKRGYYLEQIVGQTEYMDEMVREMIYISKLDSEKLVLNKVEVSLRSLIEEALESLYIYIEEKQLKILYKGYSDRIIEGDPQYLKKAIWNILSNAVTYNEVGGYIEIVFEESSCKIRNTGKHIPEEELSQVFDMFYTGNKSRTSGEKHLGLGLYLTKKIFDLHDLIVEIRNIEGGVEVIIKK